MSAWNESPTTSDAHPSPNPLACPECRRLFSRPSHLDRHRLTHLPAARKNLVPCPRCNSTFARRDVMLRHLRATHNVEQFAPRSVQRSCERCVAKKLRCDRTTPCRGCAAVGSKCEYPASASIEHPSSVAFQAPVDDDRAQPSSTDGAVMSTDDGPLLEHWSQPDQQQRTGGINHLVPGDTLPQALRTPESADDENTYSSMPMGTPGLGFQDTSGGLFPAGDGALNIGGDDSLSPSYIALMQPELRSHGFDWLGFDMPGSGLYVDTQQQWQPQSTNLAMQTPAVMERGYLPPTGPQHAEPIQRNHTLDALHVEPTAPSRNSPVPALRPLEPQQAWPFDQTRDTAPRQYKLPPLKDVLQSARHAACSPEGNLMDDFVQLLSDQRLPALGSIQRPGVRQAFGEVQRLLDLYFDRFHDIQAIIHKPTWNMAACPTVLLTAMTCIGALLSSDRRDTELSSSLSDLCMSMINWLGSSDGNNYTDVSYLNALCIHQIYSLGSGNRQLYQNADRSRGVLIGSLRGIGLLGAQWSTGDDESPEADSRLYDDPASVAREWHAWVKAEEGRRAAWAAFEYDCSLCTLTSRRGAVDLGELPRKLPCIEALWNAASPQAWLALRSRLSPASFSPNLFVVLKTCLAGKEMGPSLGSWAKRLCGQVLGRLLWDIKELEVIAMPNRLGLHSMLNPYRESKRSILSALDGLLTLTAMPSSTADLITYNITGLLCHYSHLYAAEDVMDVIIYIVRNLLSQNSSQQRGLEAARKRLRSIFARDPRGSRSLAWHSAQMIAIANEYLVSAPCEIMRVFMGYVYIMAYSAYGPRHGEGQAQAQKPPVRLDTFMSTTQKADVDEWMRSGGPATIGSVGDISAPGRLAFISADAQSILQKLQCWGLADKFTRILSMLGTEGM